MDIDLIQHYAHELHWHLPEETQNEAIEWLIENTPRAQLACIFPPYSKSCWQNAMKVIEAIVYSDNETAFPRMVEAKARHCAGDYGRSGYTNFR